MEFHISRHLLENQISIWNSERLLSLKKQDLEAYSQICKLIDELGAASAKAQSLPVQITTAVKLQHSEHRLYIHADSNNRVNGILKVGVKNLFISTSLGIQKEISPLCVLDFYVIESRQRTGIGKQLFDFMLEVEDEVPSKLAYDRPSHKLLSFLSKHFHLSSFTPQANNFVVFHQYFSSPEKHPENTPISRRPLTASRKKPPPTSSTHKSEHEPSVTTSPQTQLSPSRNSPISTTPFATSPSSPKDHHVLRLAKGSPSRNGIHNRTSSTLQKRNSDDIALSPNKMVPQQVTQPTRVRSTDTQRYKNSQNHSPSRNPLYGDAPSFSTPPSRARKNVTSPGYPLLSPSQDYLLKKDKSHRRTVPSYLQ